MQRLSAFVQQRGAWNQKLVDDAHQQIKNAIKMLERCACDLGLGQGALFDTLTSPDETITFEQFKDLYHNSVYVKLIELVAAAEEYATFRESLLDKNWSG